MDFQCVNLSEMFENFTDFRSKNWLFVQFSLVQNSVSWSCMSNLVHLSSKMNTWMTFRSLNINSIGISRENKFIHKCSAVCAVHSVCLRACAVGSGSNSAMFLRMRNWLLVSYTLNAHFLGFQTLLQHQHVPHCLRQRLILKIILWK